MFAMSSTDDIAEERRLVSIETRDRGMGG